MDLLLVRLNLRRAAYTARSLYGIRLDGPGGLPGTKDRVYARFIRQADNNVNIDEGGAWSGYAMSVPSVSIQSSMDWTRTFSPNLVNEARLSYSRLSRRIWW